jgi:prepilin-type N-terminal cleavage/methylation domain-containing protein
MSRTSPTPRTVDCSPHCRRTGRAGFTLAELIVAVVLLTVGLGALASTTTWTIREAQASRRTERAATIARSRLDLLRLVPCVSLSGEATHGDLVERWSVALTGKRARTIVSVAARDSGHMREQRYETAFAC